MRGQISVETLLSIAVLLLFFIIVSVMAANQDSQTIIIKERLEKENQCLEIAQIVTALFSGEGETRITISSFYDINFSGNTILTAETFCKAPAKLTDSFASAGTIEIVRTSSGVLVQNA